MEKIIAFCGLNCSECSAFIATKENSDLKRGEVAKEWSKAYDHEFKPEDINCYGCLDTAGPHIGYCNICEIRKCGTEKEVENCAYCIDYVCEKLEKFHEHATDAKKRLEAIRRKSPNKPPKKKRGSLT
jgi:hypothetical protein